MKRVDATLGRLLTLLISPPPQHSSAVSPSSILLIRPGGIGDAVHCAPTIRLLKKSFPGLMIRVLAEKRNAGVFSLIPGVDQIYRYDIPQELAAALRCSCELVIDTEQWHRLSAVVARLVSSTVKIGFGTNERSRLFTYTVSYSHDEYEAESFLRLISAIGIVPDDSALATPWFQSRETSETAASGLLAPFAGQSIITIFPGASVPERRWGNERFAALVQRLAKAGSLPIIVVGSGTEQEAGAALAAEGAIDYTGKTSLPETASLLARSRVVVSGDSGVLHLAAALGRPTVSLFGPGRWKKWAPRGDQHIVIMKNLPCSPCTTYGTTARCPENTRCLTEISVEEVFDAVQTLMGEKFP